MKRDTNRSSTVLKAMRVMEAVASMSEPAPAADIARNVGLERITTYRMLKTMEGAGYLVLDPATKRYRISRRILALARPVLDEGSQDEWVDSLLRAITQRTGETCHFSELSGMETVLTRRAKGRQLVAVDFKIGTKCELHATSVGKAILAFRSAEFVLNYVRLDLRAYTERTITDPEHLLLELARVRQAGEAYDFGELSDGMNCVAIPIRASQGVEAGVSISGPATRLTPERLRELAALMKKEVARATG